MKEVVFRAGDLVWCPQQGWGVLMPRHTHEGLLGVGTIHEFSVFASDGRHAQDKYRSLLTVDEAFRLGVLDAAPLLATE